MRYEGRMGQLSKLVMSFWFRSRYRSYRRFLPSPFPMISVSVLGFAPSTPLAPCPPMIELARLFPVSSIPKVSWIRERDTTLISVGRYTYTTDQGRRSFSRVRSQSPFHNFWSLDSVLNSCG